MGLGGIKVTVKYAKLLLINKYEIGQESKVYTE